ncbi:amidase family protein [Litoreibacter roseus]|uniref:Acetamide n=1 Tax=Litoreibacter roseus TaxID=2601869 RepID=A0A6N6JI20_9RHOB|nr:amidase family protein [Litoreibacter roseus]GFE64938.1 acetamide [Litoreibacter roseus]
MNQNAEDAATALGQLSDFNLLVRKTTSISTDEAGPLTGMPVVVKANIAIADLPQCGASPALQNNIATQSASVVDRLLKAGAVVVGQANMHELAFGITSHNTEYGPVGNPAAPGHMSGGSSGGTAAAIASGAVSMGLGTDTGGSGRLPAAMCGCTGFRPTHGRYPADGVLTLSSSFDTVAPMARSVAGVRALDAVLSDNPLAEPVPPARIRLGVVTDALWQDVDAGMVEACKLILDRLVTAEGVELIPLSAPDLLSSCADLSMGIVVYETKAFWEPFLAKRGTTLAEFADQIASPDVAGIFRLVADGAAPTKEAYEEMVGPKRRTVQNMMADPLSDVDALVMPALPITAPPIGETETCRINGETVDLFTAMTQRALVASVAGYPAISLPAGKLDLLPFGLEFIGKPGQDDALLALASELEQMIGVVG